jgi:hypothetical protein
MDGETTMNTLTKVLATREAGQVVRCHTVPRVPYYDVAQHTFGALNLLLLLHPGPSVDLIKAVQWHDVAERWTGDVPATAKWGNPALGEFLAERETDVLTRLELSVSLGEEDTRWLKAVDILDLWLWGRENLEPEHDLTRNCVGYIHSMHAGGRFPPAAFTFFQEECEFHPGRTLSSVFSRVLSPWTTKG